MFLMVGGKHDHRNRHRPFRRNPSRRCLVKRSTLALLKVEWLHPGEGWRDHVLKCHCCGNHWYYPEKTSQDPVGFRVGKEHKQDCDLDAALKEEGLVTQVQRIKARKDAGMYAPEPIQW